MAVILTGVELNEQVQKIPVHEKVVGVVMGVGQCIGKGRFVLGDTGKPAYPQSAT